MKKVMLGFSVLFLLLFGCTFEYDITIDPPQCFEGQSMCGDNRAYHCNDNNKYYLFDDCNLISQSCEPDIYGAKCE